MKKQFKVLSSIVLLLSATIGVQARTWSVDVQNGSNEKDGSATYPFATISKAARKAIAGDTILIYSGVYREWVSPENGGINENRRITYLAAPGHNVHVKGSEEIENWKKADKNLWRAEVPNELFGDFNPFDINVFGDWLDRGSDLHLGEVYVNNTALNEVKSLAQLSDVKKGWFAEVRDEHTVIYARYEDLNINKEQVEINVRPTCFFPKTTGVNYITVKGIEFSQAATQWSPPTGEQTGAVGPNWSKGWIIEDCRVSNSRCVGICLGKERASGHNLWQLYKGKFGYTQHGFNREIEAIIKAYDLGWSKENIGSHLVRNNEIFACGQAGIVGHLGCAFSVISHNEIYNIGVSGQFSGAEMAGIKLHAAIDAIIEDNLIVNTARGMWLDWQAQGTHIRGNIIDKSRGYDLFIEVSHGPTLVYNNILLTEKSLRINAQGIAFFNNLVAGTTYVHCSTTRFTPYHMPHSTKIKGLFNSTGGDVRFYNNLFVASSVESRKDEACGLSPYNGFPLYRDDLSAEIKNLPDLQRFKFPVWTSHNVFFKGTTPYKHEQDPIFLSEVAPEIKLIKTEDHIYSLDTNLPIDQLLTNRSLPVSTENMYQTFLSEALFENIDATPFLLDHDIMGNIRDASQPVPGPFEMQMSSHIWQR